MHESVAHTGKIEWHHRISTRIPSTIVSINSWAIPVTLSQQQPVLPVLPAFQAGFEPRIQILKVQFCQKSGQHSAI
jgi:hypothetical protein